MRGETLIAEVREIDRRFGALTSFATAILDTNHVIPRSATPVPRSRSAKRDGALMRSQWVAQLKTKGVELRGSGKRYIAPSGALVGLAPANELPGKPNRWFLGLADEPTDVVVLLCRSDAGTVYDLVIPAPDLGPRWELLSRSTNQIKFNVRKEVSEFFLLIPGDGPFRVTQHLTEYGPLRARGTA